MNEAVTETINRVASCFRPDNLIHANLTEASASITRLAAELIAIADDLDGLAPLIANHAVKLDGAATILRERRDRIRAVACSLNE